MKRRKSLLHVLGWILVLFLPLFFNSSWLVNGMEYYAIIHYLIMMLPLFIIYILNYTLFLPKLFNENRRISFFVANACMIVVLLVILYVIRRYGLLDVLRPERFVGVKARPSELSVVMREALSFVLTVGFVSSICIFAKYTESEAALREAESAKVKAELSNLRSQINPHFLLNTLNNIYALISFNRDGAQKAILELSKLLRYILYENQGDKVALTKEVEFLSNYIELMKIRLNKNVEVDVDFQVDVLSQTQIAPLIFISLIENAFKHGVSASEKSFIKISLIDKCDENKVIFVSLNTFHPKGQNDKSGSGIGLDLVKKRLDLLYPDKYIWNIDKSDGVYKSELICIV